MRSIPLSFYAGVLCAVLAACSSPSPTPETVSPMEAVTPPEINEVPWGSYSEYDIVSSGLVDQEGTLWFGTSLGLLRWRGDGFDRFTTEDGLFNHDISEMVQLPDGRLALGTLDGVAFFDGEQFEHLPLPAHPRDALWEPVFTGRSVVSLLLDTQGFLWIGTCGSGVYRYDGETLQPFLHEGGRLQVDGYYHNVISDVLQDANGTLWFTSQTHGGITRLDGDVWTNYDLGEGLKDDMFLTAYEDEDGLLFFGALGNDDGGLHTWDSQSFNNYTEADGLTSKNVCAIAPFTDDTLILFSQREGPTTYKDGTFHPVQDHTVGGLDLSDVRFATQDPDGNIWMGGRYGKLFRLDAETRAIKDFTHWK